MRIEQAVQLPISFARALQGVEEVSSKELAGIAAAATSSGEVLLERSGLPRLDEANQCHFGAQLGRSVNRATLTALPLRWWNDKARSLTPGFIGELRVRPHGEQVTEFAVTGEYHPRSHLYELVEGGFLSRMANAVVRSFLDQLRDRILEGIPIGRAEATA